MAAATFTENQLDAAANRAADDILAATGAGDEGPRDLVNLVVNTTAHCLRQPDATLEEAIRASCQRDLAEVLEWAQG
jgi:hypothetical protein